MAVLLLAVLALPAALTLGHPSASAAPGAPLARAWGTPVAAPPGSPHSQPLVRAQGVHAAAFAPAFSQSSNWSGYVESGGPFTSISGQWTVPTVQPSQSLQSSGTWIGIDGVTSNSLIQTGTGQDTANGQTQYYAWFEVLPQPAQIIGNVSPGDVMQASITETALGSNEWTISIQDVTSNQIVSPSGTYPTPGQTADWIEEAPTGSQGILTLADYGTVTFTRLGVNGSPPPANTLQPVSMIDASTPPNVISQPGPYDAGANSFSITYTGPGSSTSSSTTSTTVPTGPPPSTCTGSADHPIAGAVAAIAAMRGPTGCAGYWVATADGQVAAFGAAQGYGNLTGAHAPVIDIIATPTGLGYWVATADGTVHAFGDAVAAGDMSGHHLNGSIIAMAATPDGRGYWLVGSDGGIFAFGDARFFGSTGSMKLNRPVVGIAPAPGGAGYWLVASDGGVFAFGGAPFLGSMGGGRLNRPVVAMTADPGGRGYRMVGADGGIFSFGAPFFGSLGSTHLSGAITTMAPSIDGNGYYLLGVDGSVYAFGDAPYLGRT